MWLIPAGTPRRELAEVALNLIYGEEMQLAFCREGSLTSLPAVAARMASEDPLWKLIYPSTDAQLQSVRYYPYDAYFRAWDHINEVWDREVLRKG
jgi:hypothetical protein